MERFAADLGAGAVKHLLVTSRKRRDFTSASTRSFNSASVNTCNRSPDGGDMGAVASTDDGDKADIS